MSLASNVLSSIKWRLTGNAISVLMRFVQAVILARLLSVEVFGVFQFAAATLAVCSFLADLCMDEAFISQAPETADRDKAASVLLTMLTILGVVWGSGCLGTIFLLNAMSLLSAKLCMVLVALVVVRILNIPAIVLQSLCVRDVRHRRPALLRVIHVGASTVAAVVLAMCGFEIWALLAISILSPVIMGVGLCCWRPIWRLRFGWDQAVAKYYVRFGATSTVASLLTTVMDRLDNIWIGGVFGDVALGLYARAFKFALYPSTLLSPSINVVSRGAYTKLKNDRKGLSKAFFRSTAVLLRAGFLFSGVLMVTAPEFVVLLIGGKWLPAVPSLRCLLLFSVLYPLRQTFNGLFLSVGRPDVLVRTRLAQIVILVAGLVILVPVFASVGAAITVSIMTAGGVAILNWESKKHVDCTMSRLMGGPIVASATAAVVSLGVTGLVLHTDSLIWLLILKTGLFSCVYAAILLLMEREDMVRMWRQAREHSGPMLS